MFTPPKTMPGVFASLVTAGFLTVSGCANVAPIEPPAISDIRDSMVRVQASQSGAGIAGRWPDDAAIMEEALRGCSRYTKTPTFMSVRCVVLSSSIYRGCEIREHLYTCD